MHLLLRFVLACPLIVGCLAGKPGKCPPREGGIRSTVCKWDCTSDNGCRGEQKCCSYGGCLDVCKTPIQKPCNYNGLVYQHEEQFMDQCNKCWCRDGSVSCTEKGCGGKPGTCPPREGEIGPTVCKWDCTSDNVCPGEQKCCSYGGCVDVCKTPILPR